ncbi:SDR family NAD(P)-dependent oxidoreductase [Actinokineospora sp. G85]|uniref:SDR family NAD(P)-dependent oxidoreductase n=1 Tax=Actinokineospora sp. G85 TaxID=3406626 RepID=UPI003C73425C
MTSLLNLDSLDLGPDPDGSGVQVTRAAAAPAPVAVIGMSGRVGHAADLAGFWAMLLRGEEGHRDLSPERRADVDAYLAARGARLPIDAERYVGGTRLPSLAGFDHRFFGLSPQEARMVDPNQRIFLETAWAALEDAGYLNKDAHGEKVGVYAGMSTDFGEDYRAVIQAITPDAPEISVAGNVKSMIGSRIAYLLDLRGPSMLIDTACSSGLVAAYTAVRAIQRGECAMALAGAVNCDLLPIEADDESGIGIKDIQDTSSADHRTRTFDRLGDGTSAAEGCVVFVLKSLDRARRDGDNIHAVIMGGAVNQDGASNGITAPNVEAQADLIAAALADAGVRAEQVSFIEAHGTATKLGDPVEVSGIERAFSRQTSRKQFCGIGSAKTNIGHMDNASGLAGLAKLVLSLKHRVLPASLNFAEPNPNIGFAQSPVFVNDRTVPWSDDDQETLYAGINSFGLSGTNCHLVVRSADPLPARETETGCFLLPLSARDPRALTRLARRYRDFLADNDVRLADLSFTASVGRLHHNLRAAFVFDSRDELIALLDRFADGGEEPDAHRGEFRLVAERRGPHDITQSERDELSRAAAALVAAPAPGRDALRQVAALYARGAEVDWRRAAPVGARRVSLPTYPFEPTRCWIEADGAGRRGGLTGGANLVRTLDRDICVVRLNPAGFWELSEHRIHGVCVLPGTAIVELVVEAARRLDLCGPAFVLRRIQFAAPLAVADGEDKEAHVLFEPAGGITVASRSDEGEWVVNATAELVRDSVPGAAPAFDLDAVRGRVTRELEIAAGDDEAKGLVISDRWLGSLLGGHADDDATEILYEFELPARYRSEVDDYLLHPALLDALINAPNNLYDTDRLYLPFSYGVLTVHDRLPARVFAHFAKRPGSVPGQLHSFDVTVTDPAGRVVLAVDDYCIKSAADLDMTGAGEYGYVQAYREVAPPAPRRGSGAVLLCGEFGDALPALERALAAAGHDRVHLADGEHVDEHREFAFGLLSCAQEGVTEPVEAAFALLKLISDKRLAFVDGLLALTRDALAVTGDETSVDPGQAGVLGMLRIAALEYKSLGIRCLDRDDRTAAGLLVAEAAAAGRPPVLHYRDGQAHEPYVRKRAIPLNGGAAAPLAGDGVAVISGGTGGLGLAVARHLAQRGARKIALLGSPRPGTPDLVADDLRAEVDVLEVVRLDMGDGQAVERAMADLRERHGRIAGVLHLAGRPGVGFLHTKDLDTFRAVYRPKALGGLHLHEATLADDLDYFVAFSSVSGLLPHHGQTDYTAANLVLDSLAQHRTRERLPALSVQWPAWREVGMAERMGAVDEDEVFPPLDTAEAVDLLHALMAWPDHPPVVMPGRMRKAVPAPRRQAGAGTGSRAVTLHGFDDVGDIERRVAEIWAETLGVAEFDAHDDFAGLGGNSLLTSQMLRIYGERFPDVLDITDLFRYTTIAEQAARVRERLHADEPAAAPPAGTGEGDIDRLLDMLEQGEITVERSQGS